MKKLLLITFLIILIFVSACTNQKEVMVEDKTKLECTSDLDCNTAGCSSQICTTKDKALDIVTTCEYKEEYSCLQKTSCGCFEGKCQFEQNNDYLECLDNFK